MATSLATLRTRIRQRTDNEHTGEDFVTDTELNGLINKAYYELFAVLVKAGLHSVPESLQTITADGSTSYDLSDDFYLVQGVFRVLNNARYRLYRHTARYRQNTGVKGNANSYRTFGYSDNAKIEFIPTPNTGTYEVVYIAHPTELSADVDTVDGVLGWEEYIVLDVGIDVLDKEGVDSKHLWARRDEMRKRIREEAWLRDSLETHVVAAAQGRRANSLFDEEGYLPGDYRGVAPWFWRF